MHTKIKYKIGADPELFVEDQDTHSILSAHDLVPGSKIEPRQVEGGAIQADGTAAEFNITPATDAKTFASNIRRVLKELQHHVQTAAAEKHHAPVLLKVQPTAFFDIQYFHSLPPEALAFGCTPDFNAWTEKINDFLPTGLPMRTGGGHVHVGWTDDAGEYEDGHFADCQFATKQLDAALFIPSLLWDDDKQRRTLYGKVGSFRPKPYGVEYRPLSNAWVSDPDLHLFVFETAKRAIQLLDENDSRLWESDRMKTILERSRNNHVIDRNEVLECHLDAVDRWLLPVVPPRYLGNSNASRGAVDRVLENKEEAQAGLA